MKSQVYLFNWMNWLTFRGSSRGPIETPRNTTWSCTRLYISCMAGISARQGGHQVPQKLISKGLPCSDSRLIVFPVLGSFHWKLGGNAPTFGSSPTPTGLTI